MATSTAIPSTGAAARRRRVPPGWFGVPAGNFYSWLFVTFGFSLVTRYLRDVCSRRPGLDRLQLLVPIPAFVLLIASIVPFAVVKPLVDPSPGTVRISDDR